MDRVEVPFGWVVFSDPKSVTEGQRRPVVKASMLLSAKFRATADGADPSEDDIDKMSAFNDAVIIALVKEWSFDAPVSHEGLLEIPGAAYDVLQRKVSPMVSDLMPSFEADPSEVSPTVPSAE